MHRQTDSFSCRRTSFKFFRQGGPLFTGARLHDRSCFVGVVPLINGHGFWKFFATLYARLYNPSISKILDPPLYFLNSVQLHEHLMTLALLFARRKFSEKLLPKKRSSTKMETMLMKIKKIKSQCQIMNQVNKVI